MVILYLRFNIISTIRYNINNIINSIKYIRSNNNKANTQQMIEYQTDVVNPNICKTTFELFI